MKKHRHLLANVWESFPILLSSESKGVTDVPISEYIIDALATGPFYYYVIDIVDYSIQQVSEKIKPIHGLTCLPTKLDEIINLIHPEDFDFVVNAEKATIEKMQEIGFEHQLYLKTSYCFRMRTADESYHLFHHQAVHLAKDDEGKLVAALNIHTDIQHITQTNNKIVLVQGIGPRDDYCQIDLSNTVAVKNRPVLSNREMEVLQLLAQGMSSQQIAAKLFISELTVRTHRKNILKKTDANNSSNLIKKSIEWGLV